MRISPLLLTGDLHLAQVVKQGDGWYCEYDSKLYPDMVRRYVMLARFIDSTGECLMSVFNEHVRHLTPDLPQCKPFAEGWTPGSALAEHSKLQWTAA